MAKRELADTLALQLRASHCEGFEREFKFHPTRKWRSDFAWPNDNLLVEVDGGQWVQGTGHNSGTGKERDCEKDAEAVILGYRVLRFTTNMVEDGRALRYIERALGRN